MLLAPFLREHASHLRLLFLSPYSPQLASIEPVWKLTRRLATYNRYFPTLEEVLQAVNVCFDPLAQAQPHSVKVMLHYLSRYVLKIHTEIRPNSSWGKPPGELLSKNIIYPREIITIGQVFNIKTEFHLVN